MEFIKKEYEGSNHTTQGKMCIKGPYGKVYNIKFKNAIPIVVQVNQQINTCDYGIYTWVLVEIKKIWYFIFTKVYSIAEVESKHGYILSSFVKQNDTDVFVLIAGEFSKQNNGFVDFIKLNFFSGTYVLDHLQLLTEHIKEITDELMKFIATFSNLYFVIIDYCIVTEETVFITRNELNFYFENGADITIYETFEECNKLSDFHSKNSIQKKIITLENKIKMKMKLYERFKDPEQAVELENLKNEITELQNQENQENVQYTAKRKIKKPIKNEFIYYTQKIV